MRPLHAAVKENLSQIDIVFEPNEAVFKRADRAQTASGRETTVTNFLRNYFPSDWSVKKGPIYDAHDAVTDDEIDCVVCIPQHPPIETPKRKALLLADGVYAAVEVKPDLQGSELNRALKQCVSVKRLQRTIQFTSPRTSSWPTEVHRIPFVIFAKHTAKTDTLLNHLDKKQMGNSAWDLPDIVFGYDSKLVYHAADASICSIAPLFEGHSISSGEAYVVFEAKKADDRVDLLLVFVALLQSFAAPRPHLAPILKDYLFPIRFGGSVNYLQAT